MYFWPSILTGCLVLNRFAGVAAAMGVEAEVRMADGYPCCHNDPAVTEMLLKAAGKVLGPENILEQEAPTLGTDDFGYFSALVPGCYYYIGVGNAAKGYAYPNHNPILRRTRTRCRWRRL